MLTKLKFPSIVGDIKFAFLIFALLNSQTLNFGLANIATGTLYSAHGQQGPLVICLYLHGVSLVLCSLFGFFAAMRKSPILLLSYAIVLGLLTILNIALACFTIKAEVISSGFTFFYCFVDILIVWSSILLAQACDLYKTSRYL
ncbi:unnamed protein product [Hymenolepis diminuta]|uniref:MARVEL domain-containing protein n=1 Tax=Hymenolepis diminuta TaxID=6216 RepID=A0A0R3SAL1_HYMDI|nr:unnamed protein product [Hymenolepis diminuta]VUZ45294.1 unnamed protein product [Hymenolepis diminuta]